MEMPFWSIRRVAQEAPKTVRVREGNPSRNTFLECENLGGEFGEGGVLSGCLPLERGLPKVGKFGEGDVGGNEVLKFGNVRESVHGVSVWGEGKELDNQFWGVYGKK